MSERVVVLGAGYAGVMAANRLARAGVDVEVVTPDPVFVERVRLHRVAAGHRADARVALRTVLHPDVGIRTGTARCIDAGRGTIRLASGHDVGFDRLVVAVGSGRTPDDRPHLHRVANEDAALRLRAALAQHPDAPVTVVGAGLTGVAVACALATAGRRVEIVSREPRRDDPYHQAQRRRLRTLGIVLRRGERDDLDAGAGIVVDATGFQVPRLAADSGLPVDERGRLLVGPDLRVPTHPDVLGAGDAVHVVGDGARHLRMSCATALPMGAHAARVISELRADRPTTPFRHSYVVRCIDLGGAVGRVQFVTATDEERRMALTSVPGGLGKELVVRGTIRAMRHGARRRAPRSRSPVRRPITTRATEEWNDTRLGDFAWTSGNVGEAIPGVMTPVTWSLVRVFLSEAMAPSTVGGFRLAGNIGGRLYLNLSVLLGASAAIGLGRRVRGTVEQVFGRFPADLEVPPLPLPRRTIVVDLLRTGIPFALRVAGHRRNLPARVEAARTRCEVVRRRIRGTTTPDGLAALWHSDVEPLLRHTSRLLAAGARTNGAAVVRTRPWLVKRVGAADADALLTGAGAHGGHLESLGPVVGLARVARGDLGRDSYLRTWGHRCPDEFEVSAPRPVEDPDWIDRQLAAVPAGESDPLALLARQERVRDAARARFRARHPRREGSLRRRLARVAEATRAREAGRSEAVRAFLVLREFILRAGELTGLGEDLFFCTYEEILAVLADDTGVLDRVPARRTTYERLAALPPYPSLIRGEFDPFRWAADRRTGIHDATGDTLTGFPGVAGVVEGTARVLDRVEQRDRLDAGAILVTTAANVGWTPLFPRAFAVVTDVGAPLSHAAVVARELGIPAVVGCGDATTRIRSGDRIRVDGAAGTVEILDRDRGDEPGERR